MYRNLRLEPEGVISVAGPLIALLASLSASACSDCNSLSVLEAKRVFHFLLIGSIFEIGLLKNNYIITR
jgi:hypothetical protein